MQVWVFNLFWVQFCSSGSYASTSPPLAPCTASCLGSSDFINLYWCVLCVEHRVHLHQQPLLLLLSVHAFPKKSGSKRCSDLVGIGGGGQKRVQHPGKQDRKVKWKQ